MANESDEPDSAGLMHGRVHKETGRSRPARSAKVANDDVIERAEQLLLEPIVNRMAAGERACQMVIDLVVELRASRARVAELEQDARRLDWLGRPTRILTVFESGSHMTADRGEILTRTSLRDLVDAAMAGEGEP